MALRSLRYFCAAAEAGSLTAAAERCHVAQPSISNAVAQLEQEFALRLFSRSKKGVTLTPEGDAFYQEATRLLGSAGEMEQRFKRVERPRLSVAIDSSLASRDSGYLLQLTAGRLQNYRLQVRTQPTQPADLWLLSERQVPDGFHFIALLEQEYRLLLPRGWSLNQPRELEQATRYPWIDRLDCELRSAFLERLPDLADHASLQVDTEDLALSLVQHRQGATVMAVSDDLDLLSPAVDSHSLRGLVPEPLRHRQLGLACRAELKDSVMAAFG